MWRSLFFFFFSSRRRHTRWTGDWSSDVCSCDLHHLRARCAVGRGGHDEDQSRRIRRHTERETVVVVLGIILLLLGLLASIPILTTLGVILVVVGLVLNLVPIGGTRRRYY